MSSTLATTEAIWLRTLLADLGYPQNSPTILHEDNQGSIALARNPSSNARAKHIDVKHHILREHVANGTIDPHYVNTKDNVAEIFTKPLARGPFTTLRGYLGLR